MLVNSALSIALNSKMKFTSLALREPSSKFIKTSKVLLSIILVCKSPLNSTLPLINSNFSPWNLILALYLPATISYKIF